jgi:hypothetical protein
MCFGTGYFRTVFIPTASPSLSLWCGRASRHRAAMTLAWAAHDKEARAALDTAVQRRRWTRSRVDQCGRTSTSGSPADLAPSPSCAGRYLLVASFLPRRAATAVGPLPTVNSTHQRASILPSSMEMLCCAERAYCKRMFQVFQIFRWYVASICFKCFRCFIWMLQVFSQCFICFRRIFVSVLIGMLHMFHTYMARVYFKCLVLYCSKCFHVARCNCLSKSCIYCNSYTCMLQVYVSNV